MLLPFTLWIVSVVGVYGPALQSTEAEVEGSAVVPMTFKMPFRVLHTGELHDDVVALGGDVRLRDAERVDALGHDVRDVLQRRGVDLVHRLVDDRQSALEVETEMR